MHQNAKTKKRGLSKNGDILVADMEEMDASELHARNLNAKEVLMPQRSGNFVFPVADGTVKVFGGEQRLRISTLTRDRPERGEEQKIFKENQMSYILQPRITVLQDRTLFHWMLVCEWTVFLLLICGM